MIDSIERLHEGALPDSASVNAGATRDRILAEACKLFADKGFRGTTIAEVCRKAQANIAAVNYHFGTKEKLYQQAWRFAHDRLAATAPLHDPALTHRPAAQRLRAHILNNIQRAMLGDGLEFRIMRHEMTNPTGLLRQVIDDAIGPVRHTTQAILRELLGPSATDMDVELCEVCVVAPMMHLIHRRQAQKHEGIGPVFAESMLPEVADHFTAYALAGVAATRQRVEARVPGLPSASPAAPQTP